MSVVLMEGKMNTKKNERFAETDRRIRKAFTKMAVSYTHLTLPTIA